ncbi:hypothetical protein [Nocardioides sp. MH1]|uniref:hypothetical protein n=1 Tax=Nocardioides sp. MH1 TaxID=3242490 RepID=UPI00351FEF25
MSTATQAEAENRYAGQGAVLLDIGGDVGALVVTMPEHLLGTEIEIEPVDGHHGHEHSHGHGHDHDHGHDHGGHHRAHVAVVSRPVLTGSVASLVFPELREGRYRLFAKGEHEVRMEVEVVGAQVTTTAWAG